ncbi:MAG TPA: hypothetical protein VGN79_12345 [Devosia sp.]|jgi:hypothetical protein|nr:hypothetical protein [Devosia sp.]
MTDPMEKMTELLGMIAEQKVNAAMTANLIVLSEIVNVLIDKDLLTRQELLEKLRKLDVAASLQQSKSPDIAKSITHMTLLLREAFQLDDSGTKPS